MKKGEIRVYVIADDYRWHILTEDILLFNAAVAQYVSLMSTSQKENSYYFMNRFMTRDDYEQTLRIMAANKERSGEKKNYLKLVT